MKLIKLSIFILLIFITIAFQQVARTYISSAELRKSEKEMVELVNIERGKHGSVKLEFNEQLYKVAMDHNRKMAEEDTLAHNFERYKKLDQRMVDIGLYYITAGENIAFSNVYPSDYIHAGFVKSPSHFSNIINPGFRQCGIAILETDRGFYITQEFADIIFTGSEKNAEERISEYINKNKIFSNRYTSEKLNKMYKNELDQLSLNLLHKGSTGIIPDELRGFNILTIRSNKVSKINEYITSINAINDYESGTFGITFGRSKQYPGGVFSVVFLLKKKLNYGSLSLDKIEAEVLRILNNKENITSGKSFYFNKNLSSIAAKAVHDYYKGDNSMARKQRYNILAYQTSDPYKIPEEYYGFFLSNNKRRAIGISIYIPEEKGIPVDYYLIAFVFKN